jgi:D-lyxose ketol-isomerase
MVPTVESVRETQSSPERYPLAHRYSDGTIVETHPGETVTCPPDEEHWHRATAE